MAQVLNPGDLLPRALGRNVLLRHLSRVRSVYRQSCNWSCGALSRLLAIFILRAGVLEGCDCRVCGAGSLWTSNCFPPRFFRCLGRFLNAQLCRDSILVIKGAEVGGKGCFNNCDQASLQGVLRWKASRDCVLDHCLDARLGCSCGVPEPRCLELSCIGFWTGPHPGRSRSG